MAWRRAAPLRHGRRSPRREEKKKGNKKNFSHCQDCVSGVEFVHGRRPHVLFLAYRRVGPCSLVSCFRFSEGFPLAIVLLFVCFCTIFTRLGTHLSAAPRHPASTTGEAGPIYPSLPRPQAQLAWKGDGDTGGFVAWAASHNGNPWFSPFFFSSGRFIRYGPPTKGFWNLKF